jgi:hypothetical protein
MAKRTADDVVSASEIGSWAFCPEAWRLQSLGCESENKAALERGESSHAKTAAVERHSTVALRLGLVLLALGVIVLGLYLLAAVGR